MFERSVNRLEYVKSRIRDMAYAYKETLKRYNNTDNRDLRSIMWSDLKYYSRTLKKYQKELESYETKKNDGPESA